MPLWVVLLRTSSVAVDVAAAAVVAVPCYYTFDVQLILFVVSQMMTCSAARG